MISLSTASEEESWLRCLLVENPLWKKPMSIVLIHCDSTATIAKKLRTVIIMVKDVKLEKKNTSLLKIVSLKEM